MNEGDWTRGELAQGLRCYEAGEFFAAHEAWETVWLQAAEPDRTLLQALIQLAAAFHHLKRNNRYGAVTLLQAALERLAPYADYFGGIALAQLRDDLRQRLQSLEQGQAAARITIRLWPC